MKVEVKLFVWTDSCIRTARTRVPYWCTRNNSKEYYRTLFESLSPVKTYHNGRAIQVNSTANTVYILC